MSHVHAIDCVMADVCPTCGHLCCGGECACECRSQPCLVMLREASEREYEESAGSDPTYGIDTVKP